MRLTLAITILLAVSLASAEVRPQNPGVWDALDQLRGKGALLAPDIQELLYNAEAGVDFPLYSTIPQTHFYCSDMTGPGFYADVEARCQVFRRCDLNGNMTSYLCPNMTLFNQITLVCDWFYNIDCQSSKNFYDYSNSRLYQGADVVLLDNQDVISEMMAGYQSPPKQYPQQQYPQPQKHHRKQPAQPVQPQTYEEPTDDYGAAASRIHAQTGQNSDVGANGGPVFVQGDARSQSASEFAQSEVLPVRRKKVKRTRAQN